MPRSRLDNLDPEKQQRLFEATADEFSDKGFEGASLNRILERADMSKGSLYYYFEDKGDLFATVVERATTMLVKLVGDFTLDELTADTFWPSFERTMRKSADFMQRNEWFVRLARSFFRLRERGGPAGTRATRRVFDWLGHYTRTVLARGQALGVVRADLPLEFLVELTLAVGDVGDRWVVTHWHEMTPDERERAVAAELDAFHRLLEPRG
jgi:AcrR family transcriptional regulator